MCSGSGTKTTRKSKQTETRKFLAVYVERKTKLCRREHRQRKMITIRLTFHEGNLMSKKEGKRQTRLWNIVDGHEVSKKGQGSRQVCGIDFDRLAQFKYPRTSRY